MKKIFIALFVLILGANLTLNADESNKDKPSFDCKKARNETEKAICADSYLSKLDSAMARDFAQQRAIINKEGAQKLLENQRLWLKELVSCKSDKKCIEAKLEKRSIEILNFKDSTPNHPNPHYMQEKSIDLRNKDGKCLGDKLCKATIIGFGVNLTDKDYLNPNGAFLYLDDVGIAIVSDLDFHIQKISKQKAFKEILPFDRDEDRLMTNFVSSISIWAFDDDFLEIYEWSEGCGAYCTQGESVAYFDIESLQISKDASPKLIAKFLNDSFCQRLGENAKKSDDYQSNAPFNRCYKTLSKAQRYFYSKDFQRTVESHTNGGGLVFAQKYGRWFDTQSKAFLPTMPVRELLNDNANLRKIVVKKWGGEYCDEDFFLDNCDNKGQCKCGEADFFNNERDSQVENFWVNNARFDGENLVVAIRFPHVLRSRDADIYFSYDEIAPFADGILKRVIKSYQSYKNDKGAK
ncbi:lysozyme inhibitor LprI family protein [Helicobacter sp. 23-1046]